MLTDLRLQHFRSYNDASFEFAPGVNIIVGPNASGKTNLLEAILVLARGASYRVRDAELVQFDQPWARLDAHSNTDELRTLKLEQQSEETYKKSFVIDDKIVYRLTAPKMLPTVIFEPNHLLLLSGSPELRRSYLDDLIEQTVPGFGMARRQYKRVLAQRNALLKKGSSIAGPQMFIWNLRLSELAGKIVQERLDLIERINGIATKTYSELARTDSTLWVDYVSSLYHLTQPSHYETSLLKKLEHNFERDCILGFTTAGPHREDIQISLNDHVLQATASRGETRTTILTLKVIELQLLEAARGIPPMLLLDDVFSELDGARRQALTSFLAPYQTFITTTDADVVIQHFMDKCAIIPMATS